MKKDTLIKVAIIKTVARVVSDSHIYNGLGHAISRFKDRKKWYMPKFMKKNRAKLLGKKISNIGTRISGLTLGKIGPTHGIERTIKSLKRKYDSTPRAAKNLSDIDGPSKHAMEKAALVGLGKFQKALVNRIDTIKNISNPSRQKMLNIKTLIQSNKIFKHLQKK